MELPAGFIYQDDFISAAEEQLLLDFVRDLEFGEVRMHGVVAKRRVAHFGWNYGYESWKIEPDTAMPQVLEPLRTRVGELAQLDAQRFEEILVTHYPQRSAIGWHRDAPMFGIVAGVSLSAPCVFKMRPAKEHHSVIKVNIAARSVYLLRDEARQKWQHSITPVREPRYSITFRSIRRTSRG
jgi:DNA oxidative demethylase